MVKIINKVKNMNKETATDIGLLSHYEVTPDKKAIMLYTGYSIDLVSKFKSWGGKFVKPEMAWVVPISHLDEVIENLGSSNEIVEVHVTKDDLDQKYEQYRIGYYVLASRRGRDYPVDIFAEVIQGTFPLSGGSMKNPCVKASDDVIFSMVVPKDFAEFSGLKIVNQVKNSLPEETEEALISERDALMKRVQEIDEILSSVNKEL